MIAILANGLGYVSGRVRRRSAAVPVLAFGLVISLAALLISPALAASPHIHLTGGAGAPGATGTAQLELKNGVLEGSASARDLPRQEFGTGRFYGVWFVRTDTGDKAFLGALAQDESIILSNGGSGKVEFAATKFTTGPHAGSPIRFGAAGTNLIIVLIENNINGFCDVGVG